MARLDHASGALTDLPGDRDAKGAMAGSGRWCANRVIAAEERALEGLTRRAAHHEALTALPIQHETVGGEMLDNALGHDEG